MAVVPDRLTDTAWLTLPTVAFWIASGLLLAGLLLWFTGFTLQHVALRLGLMTLMATPLVRIVSVLVVLVRRRDYWTVAATLAVAAIVATTLAIALQHISR